MSYKFVSLLAFSFIYVGSVNAAKEWTSTDGRSMQAEFVKTVSEGSTVEVVFRKDDGMHYRVPLNSLSDASQKEIEQLQAKPAEPNATISAPEAQMTEFEQTITKNLVQLKGSRVKSLNQSDLSPKDYYAIYYSAHWCPPCRGFTPKLVEFYEDASKKNDNFEIIFVSSDRSEEEMEEYIEESEMPWPALEFDKKKKSEELTKYAGGGIPCLVLVDNNGKVLADSYVKGKYVGPTTVMNALKDKLK